MEEDGVMMNFLPSGSGASSGRTAKITTKEGGKWTERAKAMNKAKRRAVAIMPQDDASDAINGGRGDNKKQRRGMVAPPTVAESTRDILASLGLPPSTSSSSHSSTKLRGSHSSQTTAAGTNTASTSSFNNHSGPIKASSASSAANPISSLFSFNPTISSPDAANADDAPHKLAEPSNAPLRDVSTFQGAGLDPLLVAHLASKMSITHPTAIQRLALPPLLSSSTDLRSLVSSTSHMQKSNLAAVNKQDACDIFIQSQTGSGKTLTYLLPIIQDLLPLSSLSYIDRSIGTLAIIMAPTRELARQISEVLDSLLSMNFNLPSSNQETKVNHGVDSEEHTDATHQQEDQSTQPAHLARWMVSGLLTGGATRTHEKARLRKGVNILVSTPGRLLDHLQNTSSFNVSKCRWLVLDEADRLMELGFEDTIKSILSALDGRRNLAKTAAEAGLGMGTEIAGWDWNIRRRQVLCSATIREDVEKLAGSTLLRPLMLREADAPALSSEITKGENHKGVERNFVPPSQLDQKYSIVPLKLRLVALIGLLRSLIVPPKDVSVQTNARIIVFFSCTDSVDFHWTLFDHVAMNSESSEANDIKKSAHEDSSDSDDSSESLDEDEEVAKKRNRSHIGYQPPVKKPQLNRSDKLAARCPLLAKTAIYRLHGSMASNRRTASLHAFTSAQDDNAILLCTSVAARGLDLPAVRAVVQYDLPTEGGADEYVHRVGRTARVGRGGQAWAFVAPSEQGWVPWLQKKISEHDAETSALQPVAVEQILREGYGGKGWEYESRATDAQLAFERWVMSQEDASGLARSAFMSHMRAYATHPVEEKQFFNMRLLHLGHLAKSFALREAPSSIAQNHSSRPETVKQDKVRTRDTAISAKKSVPTAHKVAHDMYEAVRQQGRAVKAGLGEFQIADSAALGSLVTSYH